MMKSTSVIRKVDGLGRVVIPKSIRRMYHVDKENLFEIFVEGNAVVLKKYESTCTFWGINHELSQYGGYNICTDCLNNIIKIPKQ